MCSERLAHGYFGLAPRTRVAPKRIGDRLEFQLACSAGGLLISMISNASLLNLSTLSLFIATPAQLLESRKRTFHQWAEGLTEEQYIERETSIEAMEHAADSKLIAW